MKRKDLLFAILLHSLFLGIFVAMPYFTFPLEFSNKAMGKAPQMLHPESLWETEKYLRWCIQNLIVAGLFYISCFILAPYFLTKKKSVFLFSLTGTASIFVFITLIYFLHFAIDTYIGKSILSFNMRLINSFFTCLAMIVLGTGFHLYQASANLQRKQAESELMFLRSQINPHFLFNSLNNIYSLIILKADNAADAMLKLSDLLRFVLYESGEKFIPLNKELKYLDDYISLQKIRLNENVKLIYTLDKISGNEKIHPMLLIAFIENAFKYGVSYSEPSRIEILIGVNKGVLEMKVRNTQFTNKSAEINTDSGIGLKNVMRRLDIIYNKKYTFEQSSDNTFYVVNLKIDLNES